MATRNSRLAANQSPGRLEGIPWRIVHHRPPKNIAPSTIPAAPASSSAGTSFMVILIVLHRLALVGDPTPCIETSKRKSRDQQRKGPGMFSGVVMVQPPAERGAEQCWN